ncbi:MAG TPA: DUF4249 family protein [Candidatus Marinimicrobia bacterium]|nr:DUF4249 family protein [Candidatus Neomarinimicrobiota bacterium]HRS52593.1 DUF4249 family protein [Candidatus Neomarinimicrobiota bacterium]HRU92976.1 DUF4249 family protein [Candidatus Neomarinimicrobiota bacterium]
MVKRGLIFIILLLPFLYRCPAGPPTGPSTDISRELCANCLVSPLEDTTYIFVSKWSEISESEFMDLLTPETDLNIFDDYWSVSGATVKIAVDGNYLPVEEDSAVTYQEFHKIYHYYYYKFPNVTVHPGQHWELFVNHPDYNSLYAETVIPDSVKLIEQPNDTIRESSGELKFAWTQASGADGYLPLLLFVAEKNYGEFWQQEIYLDWEIYYTNGEPGGSGTSTYPQKGHSIQYSVSSMTKEIRFFIPEMDDLNQFDVFYLQFYVYSLDEALYNIRRLEIHPDELSGFNAPVRAFSNVQGGSGILGSFWQTVSPKIIIDKEFILSQCQ